MGFLKPNPEALNPEARIDAALLQMPKVIPTKKEWFVSFICNVIVVLCATGIVFI